MDVPAFRARAKGEKGEGHQLASLCPSPRLPGSALTGSAGGHRAPLVRARQGVLVCNVVASP
jgi:hypothetical protein